MSTQRGVIRKIILEGPDKGFIIETRLGEERKIPATDEELTQYKVGENVYFSA